MPTHQLKKPLSLGEITVTEFQFPEKQDIEAWMIAETRERAPSKDQSIALALIAAFSGQPYPLVRKLSVPDMEAIDEILQDLVGNGLS